MRNKIICVIVGVVLASNLCAQNWRSELEKHQDKEVKEIIIQMELYFQEIGATMANRYHQWMRWKEHAINHQNEDGFLFNHSSKNIELLQRLERQEKRRQRNNYRHFHGGWESVNPDNFVDIENPNPTMGRVNCLAKPSPESSIIYVGAATGGIWKSYDNGLSWDPLWDGMVQTGVSSIVIDYTNSNHILALTGDADDSFIPSYGIYESYNAGSTWSLLFDFPNRDPVFGYKILQSESDPKQYFIATRQSGRDILRIDTKSFPPDVYYDNSPLQPIFDIEYLTGTSDTLYASGSLGLFRRIGSGGWSSQNVDTLPTGPFTRTAIAMAPSNPQVFYYSVARAGTQTDPAFYGLYRTDNGGNTFTTVYDTTKSDIFTPQCGYNFTLDVDPFDEDIVYVGTIAHRRSIDGGKTFNDYFQGELHADNHNSYHIGNIQYLCTDGGLSIRTLGTDNFVGMSNGLMCSQFYDIDVSGNRIIGGTQDTGVKFWEEGDATGYQRIGGDGLDCMFHPTNNNIVFASTQGSKLKSTDFGLSKTILFSAEWHDPIAFATDNINKVIMHAIDELKISFDGGNTWPESTEIFGISDNVRTMDQCQDNSDIFYIAKPDSLARSGNFNDAVSEIDWTYSTFDGTGNSYIRNILVHTDSCNVLFAVSSGYLNEQIFKSVDGGISWEQYSEGIKNLPVYCIYYDHVNGNGYYIGTELGVYYRNLTMSEWIPFSTYLPRVPVYDLKVTDTYVYAGTYGRGIWRSKGYKSCVSNLILTQDNDPTNGGPSGHQIHKVSNTITSNRIIQGGADTDVQYQAGNLIDLTEGFHAKQFNRFRARAAGCLE